jgi:hypothetical protein
MATNTYVALDKVTVGTATSSITFSSIPSTYTDLFVVCSILPSSTSFYTPSLQFNGDTASNYSGTWVYGQGSSAASSRNSSQTQMALDNYAATPAVGYPMIVNFSVMNYSNTTTNKTVISRGNDVFASAGETSATVGLWRSTSAVTSLTVKGNGANFAVGSTFSLYGISAIGGSSPKATGGDVTSDATYWYHTFKMSGNFVPNQSLTCDLLVVGGGGGGGGANAGAGGGAGGLVYKTSIAATATSYPVLIGGGGVGQIPASGGGSNGGDSSALSYTGTGGGTGGYWGTTSSRNGVAGGSGGGGGEYGGAGTAGASNQNSYSGAGFGFAGGTPYVNGGDIRTGGGGGAGAVGGNGVAGGNAGSGGVGKFYNDFGSATTTGQLSGGNYYYAGGGGGSQYANGSLNGAGGLGGGGAGGTGSTNNAVSGTANTGGGGGGSGYQNASDTTRVNGGSGIVIVRYAK